MSERMESPPPEAPLFEGRVRRGRAAYRAFAGSLLVGVCSIWAYRVARLPEQGGARRWAWMALLASELWLGLYWAISQSLRWTPLLYSTFRDRLSHRFEGKLPNVDIFICTADPTIEPPGLVANTVLSLLALDYPQEKLNVYLSDDGGSILTFYAMLEVAHFAKLWLPFCKKLNVEPRSPAVYFSSIADKLSTNDDIHSMKKLYDEMESRIQTVVRLGRVPEDALHRHKGFSEWDSITDAKDHHAIVQIVVDGRDRAFEDSKGFKLPSLVYVAREKRPAYHHNFKAGAMNALIRVSSAISNSPIILNVDCDMYINDSKALRDALCFFMDEEEGHGIGYVQYPQGYHNLTKNNHYGDWINVVNKAELPGMNAYGGPCYIGSGCFHRRESISGERCTHKQVMITADDGERAADESVSMLEAKGEALASCSYEDGTQWGSEMGLKYGCAVEDMVTGLAIQCKGWRSVYFNPDRKGFLGVAPVTLSQTLVQYKRWSEGMFRIFISRHCPFIYGHKKIKLPLQMAYSSYLLWAPCSLAVLFYVSVPSLCLLKGIALFPEASSLWTMAFSYVVIAAYGQSYVEVVWSGETTKGWWNLQRAWLMRRLASNFFGFIDAVLAQLGFANTMFVVTSKVADEDVLQRYQQEIMDFTPPSMMLTLLATVAVLQLQCLAGAIVRAVVRDGDEFVNRLFWQLLLSGILALLNMPIYAGMFLRHDNGRVPTLVTFQSLAFASIVCAVALST